MRSRIGAAVVLLATACSVPFTTSSEEKKAPCDSLAAQAIQTDDLQQAKNLAAQAADCYAAAQQ